jgi:DNA-binding transcriptional MerR regulator
MGFSLAAIAEMVDGASSGRADLRRALAGLLSERIQILSEEIAVRQGQMDELEARYLALIETPKDASPDCICRALNQKCRCVAGVDRSPRRVS